MAAGAARKPLIEGTDWNFETLERAYRAIAEVALGDLGLDIYPNQIEVISAEQMLDAYSSIGMPLMYPHWSFGKRFLEEEKLYRKGYTGLAYEIVINSDPCISYNMEQNNLPLQVLVMAHAAFGHNHFFKNNCLFRQWTDAEAALGYVEFAKRYIADCEERHGAVAVEAILDAAHAVMDHGVFRYRRPPEPSEADTKARDEDRREYEQRTFSDLWRTLPRRGERRRPPAKDDAKGRERRRSLKLPEENLLYFLEKNSPVLEPWQREILRIARNIAQYFYPQKQTKVMNEGCATFVHHYIVNALYERGVLGEGAMLEILHHHANVIFQPAYDDPRYRGINPYALGFAMMQDIRRISTEPTREDERWFPDIAGGGDWRATLKHAWANFRDDSFIQQYLSPQVMRKMRLFSVLDVADDTHYTVSAIHDEQGYRKLRSALARAYELGAIEPDIQVVDVDLKGDRVLRLQHNVYNGVPLAAKSRDQVLKHVHALWGYDVRLSGVDRESGRTLYEASSAGPASRD
ncbi:MAG: SpoVR family protein [Proteobacteria bacterium]|nr:SpoVR family protein [Pseudomonadota bacterium]